MPRCTKADLQGWRDQQYLRLDCGEADAAGLAAATWLTQPLTRLEVKRTCRGLPRRVETPKAWGVLPVGISEQ